MQLHVSSAASKIFEAHGNGRGRISIFSYEEGAVSVYELLLTQSCSKGSAQQSHQADAWRACRFAAGPLAQLMHIVIFQNPSRLELLVVYAPEPQSELIRASRSFRDVREGIYWCFSSAGISKSAFWHFMAFSLMQRPRFPGPTFQGVAFSRSPARMPISSCFDFLRSSSAGI